jgi:hypothetical protein
LSYGRTSAAEDKSWAIMTPTVMLSENATAIGLMPVSFNLGQIPRQPLRDVWVGPWVGTSAGKARFGFGIFATF